MKIFGIVFLFFWKFSEMGNCGFPEIYGDCVVYLKSLTKYFFTSYLYCFLRAQGRVILF